MGGPAQRYYPDINLDTIADKDRLWTQDGVYRLRQAIRQFGSSIFDLIDAQSSASSSASSGGSPVFSAFGYNVVPIVAGNATPDLRLGQIHSVTLASAANIKPPINPGANVLWILLLNNSVGNLPPTFDVSYYGPSGISLNLTINTYSALVFIFRPDGKQLLVSTATGMPAASFI